MSWFFIELNLFGCFDPLMVRPIVSGHFGTSKIKGFNQYFATTYINLTKVLLYFSIFFASHFCIITIKESLSRKERSSHWKVFFKKVFFIATWYWQICGFPYFRKTAARAGIFCYKPKFFFREQANSSGQLSMFYRDKLSQL